jgi:hypothetical protein
MHSPHRRPAYCANSHAKVSRDSDQQPCSAERKFSRQSGIFILILHQGVLPSRFVCVTTSRDVTEEVIDATIGYGAAKAGTADIHGAALGVEEVANFKRRFGLKSRDVTEEVIDVLRNVEMLVRVEAKPPLEVSHFLDSRSGMAKRPGEVSE